ncbi:NiFe hydrogenase [Shewanella eurypsychrophilus]|uniref:NiFe hydrogenase n=1 Tax=Shewanella eurypsychrophilus TaxID=2593656 RepID=A0ABX6V5E7_9GAMM|nr:MULTISPECIES: NiFe hydrogenase [Shewanella]QFU22565.1 NiFe hydrogenase [Shewanella sp. YLB-09]QPG57854.1 NiFe hydrogenase [Shewanella eurypsychrophilus]
MKMIKFEFTCSRPVALYAHLCNQYLNHSELDITVGCIKNCYFIEAQGQIQQLEDLADAIAHDFLISVWLVDSQIILIESRLGNYQLLDNAEVRQEFCQQCFPQFGDNQSVKFGEISIPCHCCHGSTRLHDHHQQLKLTDLQLMAQQLLQSGTCDFRGKDTLSLSLNSFSNVKRPKLLICNPNTLNAQFHLKDHQVLALSSIEKPMITLRPINGHPRLTSPLYDVCFAHNRALVVICEILRQKGIDWIYFNSETDKKPMAWIQSAWSDISSIPREESAISSLDDHPEPLHDNASFNQFSVRSEKGQIYCEPYNNEDNSTSKGNAGFCALHAGNLEYKQSKNSAVIYFSEQQTGQIITQDRKQATELFFSLPSLPATGYDIYYQLEQSPQQQVVEKFKTKYPDDYLTLLDLNFSPPTDNLQSLWAIAAVILGLKSDSTSKQCLSDALISSAMQHQGSNAPRIDFPLTKGEAHRSLNWCKTIGSLISYRLADDNNTQKLAFGLQDSLADFIANWIEHLDLNLSVKSVIFAGSEFANEVLSQRLALRLGRNFPLTVNRQLDIDGNNLAIGALYLKQRR